MTPSLINNHMGKRLLRELDDALRCRATFTNGTKIFSVEKRSLLLTTQALASKFKNQGLRWYGDYISARGKGPLHFCNGTINADVSEQHMMTSKHLFQRYSCNSELQLQKRCYPDRSCDMYSIDNV